MRLPTPLLRRNNKAHKNVFGHNLILAGSPGMLGAAALCGLAAMRSGAGLVTLGIPRSLNNALQKKISPVLMTWPLPESSQKTLGLCAYPLIKAKFEKYAALAIGPGLSQHSSTRKLILRIIGTIEKPLVIDADALNALAGHLHYLSKLKSDKILTPHPGEMARLSGLSKDLIEKKRTETALAFAKQHRCICVLKGHHSIVASPQGKIYINKTGNSGMATAGSGDVLTGMLTAFLGQGIAAFEAARWAVYLHGLAGDMAAKKKTRAAMLATDIIDCIPQALKSVHKL